MSSQQATDRVDSRDGEGGPRWATPPRKPILRYHGGKWRIADWIISHFPAHEIYVEPFCGAASVMLKKPQSKVEVINDKYDRLVNLLRVLRTPELSEQLSDQIRQTPYAKTEYECARVQTDDPVEDARRMLVLSFQGHGSGGASGGKITGWRRGIRPRGPTTADEWQRLWQEVFRWRDRLIGTYIESQDAIDSMNYWDSPDTLHYIDPPYLHKTRGSGVGTYKHELSENDHVRLAGCLTSLSGHVIISGYPSDLYDDLFKGWKRVERKVSADAQQKRVEVLWISPKTHHAKQTQLSLLKNER